MSVSPGLSPTGQRQRLFFESKKLADMEVERIKGMASRWGSESTKIKASMAEDAAKADDALKEAGFDDVTLFSVVKDWIAAREAESSSISLKDLFDKYRVTKIKEGISDAYLRDIDRFNALFVDELGSRNVSTITHHEIRDILDKASTTRQKWNIYRTVRPVFSMAVMDDYAAENPFDRIPTPKHRSTTPESLSVAEVKKVFNSCTDYRTRKDFELYYQIDATDTKAAFAVMAFAGVRPEEMTRLEWSAVHFDDKCIVIDGEVSKTRSHRIIEMSDNLVEWLKTVPKSERSGSVAPPNWSKKYQLVRRESGISKRQQDILRHTFASNHLAAYSDFNALQSSMGHGTSEMILKHYKSLVRKREAIQFWSIRPDSTAPQLEATA